MNTPERVTPPPAEPVVANDPPEPNEQEKAQLLQGLETTVASFRTRFLGSKYALCLTLTCVMVYCKEQQTSTFTTHDLTTKFGHKTIEYVDDQGETIIEPLIEEKNAHYLRKKNHPPTAGYVVLDSLTTNMAKITELIKQANDRGQFPITFHRIPELNNPKNHDRVTFSVVQN